MTSSGTRRCNAARVSRAEHPVLDSADGWELIDQAGALVGRQDPACGVSVEQTERDVSPLTDVAKHLTGGFVSAGLEVWRDQEADVRPGRRGVPGQLDGFEDVRARRAGLDERIGLDGPGLLDRHLQEALALGGGEGPVFADKPADPDPVMVKSAHTVGHEGAQRVLVDLLAAGAAEGGVEGVDHPPERPGGPGAGLCCVCHVSRPSSGLCARSSRSTSGFGSATR